MRRSSSRPTQGTGSAGPEQTVSGVAPGSRNAVRAFAPASVSNLGCGFDVFGLALESPGDEVVVRAGEGNGIVALTVTGDGGGVPADPARNSAAIAVRAVLGRLGSDGGVAIELRKGIPLASGLGGSAASAVAGAVAADALLGGGLDRTALLECALTGERKGSGANHADNVVPSLAGGFTLVLPGRLPQVVELPTPAGLTVAVAHPALEVETHRARTVLGDRIPLAAAVRQWGNTAGLVAGLFREDWELIARCVRDAVAEPPRAELVPGFEKVREAALGAGAAGAGLSGAGPSVFALCRGRPAAERAAAVMAAAFRDAAGLASDTVVSPVNRVGARVETA